MEEADSQHIWGTGAHICTDKHVHVFTCVLNEDLHTGGRECWTQIKAW